MKKCRYCAEEIQDEAIKCKHCGEALNDTIKKEVKAHSGVMDGVRLGCGMFIVLPLIIIGVFFLITAILASIHTASSTKTNSIEKETKSLNNQRPNLAKEYNKTESNESSIDYSKLVPQKKSSDSYVNYHQHIREIVEQKVKDNYRDCPEEGNVVVIFSLKSDGSLMSADVDNVFSTKSQILRDIALKAIKEASPFPPFPRTLKSPNLSFTLTLSFKKEWYTSLRD